MAAVAGGPSDAGGSTTGVMEVEGSGGVMEGARPRAAAGGGELGAGDLAALPPGRQEEAELNPRFREEDKDEDEEV